MKSPLKGLPPRTAGQGLESHRIKLIDDGLAVYVLAPMLLWVITALELIAKQLNQPRMPGTYAAMAAVATAYGLYGFLRLRRKSLNLKLGRDGEREVAHTLSTLDIPGTRVFHDVPAGRFNLDHVVVCDRGVYVIETKTWRKSDKSESKLFVRNGHINKEGYVSDKPVRQAVATASWLTEQLKSMTGRQFWCQPVVVTPGWYVEEPLDSGTKSLAWVLNPTRLLGYIDQDPVRLSPEDVHLIANRLSVLVRTDAKSG